MSRYQRRTSQLLNRTSFGRFLFVIIMSKDSDKILSSLPLEIGLYFNRFLLYLYLVVVAFLFVYKRHQLIYPDSIFGYELAAFILLCIVDFNRMILASKGNLMQLVSPMLISLLLTGCSFIGYFYFLRWQTYILNIEYFLNMVSLLFISVEFLFGLLAVVRFAQQRSI